MKSPQHIHTTRWWGFAGALAVGALACAYNDPKSVASSLQGSSVETTGAWMPAPPTLATFTLAPTPGTRFVRTEHRKFESAIVGTPLARRDEQELKWQVNVDRTGNQFLVTQELQHVLMKHNGATIVDADIEPGSVDAQLVLDRSGNLTEVRGLDNAGPALGLLVRPNADALMAKALTPDGLKALVAMRYKVLTGDILGRPATAGSSWSVAGLPNSPVVSKKLTVEHLEPCGDTTCARIRADIKLDGSAVAEIASDLVKRRVERLHGDTSKIATKDAMYSMSGTILTEPATMMNHEAALTESGRITASSGKDTFEVTLNGTTQYTYEYGKTPVAQAADSR